MRVMAREDVLFYRPVFTAPPLKVPPPMIDVATFPADLRRLDFFAR